MLCSIHNENLSLEEGGGKSLGSGRSKQEAHSCPRNLQHGSCKVNTPLGNSWQGFKHSTSNIRNIDFGWNFLLQAQQVANSTQ